MKSKWIYLFLGLLLPIALTIFLRFFGKSEFNIPVYYETEIESVCPYTYTTPYTVPDSVISRFAAEATEVLVVTVDSATEAYQNFERLKAEFSEDEFTFADASDMAKNNDLLECVLLLKKPWTTVLIDRDKKIRGYYAPASREEGDRLIVEMKILLKQY